MNIRSWLWLITFTLVLGVFAFFWGYNTALQEHEAKTIVGQKAPPVITIQKTTYPDEVIEAFKQSKESQVMNKISLIESTDNPNAISPAGARGQYQIMKDTWYECTEMMGVDWDYNTDWNDPDKNRQVGEYYFFKRIPAMLKAYNIPVTTETQLACYNGGIGRVKSAYRKDPDNWKEHLPTETQNYIKKFEDITNNSDCLDR